MKVHFWGTRGSLPTSLTAEVIREKVKRAVIAALQQVESEDEIDLFLDQKLPFSVTRTYGCNTSCVEISNDTEEYILLDAGTGIRDFANAYMRAGNASKQSVFHIFMTHLHWDHVQGFPFFVPAFIPGNKIIFHGYHEDIEKVIRHQMDAPTFPVPFDALGADIEFDIQPPLTPFEVAGFKITTIEQNHPGISYGYRFEKGGKVVVYSTDSEHKEDAYEEGYRFIDFFMDADVLIFDAQYTLADATFTKANWGHSSNVMGVELAARARVKRLCMFHNEPVANDAELDEFLFNSRMYSEIYHSESEESENGKRYPEQISLAYDSLEIEL